MLNSYAVWFLDGRYSLAWGDTPEDARQRWLYNWEKGIAKVESVAHYRDPLPQHLYVATPGANWGEEVPLSVHTPISQQVVPSPAPPDLAKQIAEQVATQLAEALKHAKD